MSIDMGFVILSIIHPKNWLLDSFFFLKNELNIYVLI